LFAFAPPLLPSRAFTAFKSSADGMNLRLAGVPPLRGQRRVEDAADAVRG
jgi:hypothetical protein